MAKVKFDEIERDIGRAREEIGKSGEKQALVDQRLAKLLGDQSLQAIEVDESDEDFAAADRNTAAAQANIAALIYGLDEITKSFGSEFETLAKPTAGEKIMRVFSRKKADQMASARVKEADIRTNLNELIHKSDTISAILSEQLAVIEDRLGKTRAGLQKVQDRAATVAGEMAQLETELAEVGPKVAEFDARISEAVGEERKKLEIERTAAADRYVEIETKLKSASGVAQSLERYANMYVNYVDSLTKQASAQRTMIAKLKIDTEQRTIMYDALVESIRTSQQQNIAHRLDDVGRETDAQADAMITQIGISAQNRIAGMLESHEAFMRRTREISDKGRIANAEFARRFQGILDKLNTGKYAAGE